MCNVVRCSALNTTVANIQLFVFDVSEQLQSLYGYGQDGVSIVRSDDRGKTWMVTDLVEYTNVSLRFLASRFLSRTMKLLSDDRTMQWPHESMLEQCRLSVDERHTWLDANAEWKFSMGSFCSWTLDTTDQWITRIRLVRILVKRTDLN